MEGGDSVKIAVVDVAKVSLAREVQPEASDFSKVAKEHTSYLSILVHRRIIEVYKKYTKKLSELATK